MTTLRGEREASRLAGDLTTLTGREWGIGYNGGRPSIYVWNDDGTTNVVEGNAWAELIGVLRANLIALSTKVRVH